MKMEKIGSKKIDLQKLLAPAVLILLYIVFAIFGNKFFTLDTFKNILEASYYIGFMAFGVTFIIITGGIDLSLGTVMMCASLLGAYVFKVHNWPLILALALTIFVGVGFGFINGTLVARLKLPPFIATLGTQMMSRGLRFKKVFIRADLCGINVFPVGAFWRFGFFIIAALILHKTKFGRYTYAIGSNEEAARLSGINVDSWKVAVYTLSGFFIGMAGIFYAAAYTTITPGTGNGLEMNGITGVIIGGTSMSGGSGTMVGTLIGVFIMSVL